MTLRLVRNCANDICFQTGKISILFKTLCLHDPLRSCRLLHLALRLLQLPHRTTILAQIWFFSPLYFLWYFPLIDMAQYWGSVEQFSIHFGKQKEVLFDHCCFGVPCRYNHRYLKFVQWGYLAYLLSLTRFDEFHLQLWHFFPPILALTGTNFNVQWKIRSLATTFRLLVFVRIPLIIPDWALLNQGIFWTLVCGHLIGYIPRPRRLDINLFLLGRKQRRVLLYSVRIFGKAEICILCLRQTAIELWSCRNTLCFYIFFMDWFTIFIFHG